MESIDDSYKSILSLGLVSLREAASLGDSKRCRYEAEHLHNIPSLIGEMNPERHLYYFNQERVQFVDECRAHASATDNPDLLKNLALYVPRWDALLGHIKNLESMV